MKNQPSKFKNIFIKSNFITNFKIENIQNNNNFFIKKGKKISCKKFLVYLFLLKFKNKIEKSKTFIKKKQIKMYTILKSPYRHKLARHQIFFNRYYLSNTLKIALNNCLIVKNWDNLIKLINFLKKINNTFESNIIYVDNIQINTPIIYINNFTIKSFN